MFNFMLFAHFAGLIAWLGALLAIVIMLGMLKTELGSPEASTLAKRIIRTFSMFAHPGAVLVLISGVFMIVQMGMGTEKPFWLQVMEKGGGTIILLALILTGILGSKVRKRLGAAAGTTQQPPLKGYLISMSAVIVMTLGIMLVVSLKI
ncbi:hypothetical protein [Paenibacillus sp. UNC451MF]|uniref:hypothetical protein n=1 Tax=Paenibacillus sp. UNC451MF TaxID=1449063 RepID=UPI0004906F39|nr:hypothetical protein [Paenibacillus sp. UNC451MF]